jgi:hypothetical protein
MSCAKPRPPSPKGTPQSIAQNLEFATTYGHLDRQYRIRGVLSVGQAFRAATGRRVRPLNTREIGRGHGIHCAIGNPLAGRTREL